MQRFTGALFITLVTLTLYMLYNPRPLALTDYVNYNLMLITLLSEATTTIYY